jgi:hypothetical protein
MTQKTVRNGRDIENALLWLLTRLYPEPPLLIRRCVGGDDVPVGLQLGSTTF